MRQRPRAVAIESGAELTQVIVTHTPVESDASGVNSVSTDALVRGYRPWLDGLRGVAVLLVVVQHTMGQIPLELGSVGVGLFFALSGYLITSLLLDERTVVGSVSLSRFYIRRAARLVPALLLVLVVCNALFALANDYDPLRGSLAALTYTSNYAQVLQHDFVLGYGPTWTLAVEEHFYILWPLALLWFLRRYSLRTALHATAGCMPRGFAVASRAGRHACSLFPARHRQRGAGGRLALRMRGGDRCTPRMAPAPVTCLDRHRRGRVHDGCVARELHGACDREAALAMAAAALVVGLDYAAPMWLRRCLSLRAIATVGIISYGLYLWHGPMMRVAADFGYSGRLWRAAVVLLSVVWLGYRIGMSKRRFDPGHDAEVPRTVLTRLITGRRRSSRQAFLRNTSAVACTSRFS